MTIIEPRPQGVVDWVLCIAVLVLAIPVVVVFGPVVLFVRACELVTGRAVSHVK